MKNKKFQLAIIGYGGMGSWHAELIRGTKDGSPSGDSVKEPIGGLEVAGIFDIKQERLDAAAAVGINTYESLEAVLADSAVDIVLVSTPNHLHREIAVKALEAGKNVVCEKPVTISSIDLKAMLAAAKKSGKLFIVHQNRRWDEDFLTMKKIYDDGLLGEVFDIESRVHGSRGIPGDWRAEKAYGGGMMLDWGVHIIDQMLLLVKEKVKKVFCTVENITNGEVDDGFHLVLIFESGKRALLEVGTSNFIELARWYMRGDSGSAVIEDWSLKGRVVNITNWDKKDAVPVKTAAGLTKTMAPRTDDTIKESALPIVHSDIKDFYGNVIAAIEGESAPLVTGEQVMRVMRLMEAAFVSARENTVVDFE